MRIEEMSCAGMNWLIGALFLVAMLIAVASLDLDADSDPRLIKFEDVMSKSDKFTDQGFGNFSQLLFDIARDQLLVGARDAIYRLSLQNLQKLEKANWAAPSDKVQTCLEKGQTEMDCRNYVKVLLSSGKKLFACGTNAYSPQCSWREMEDVNRVTEWSKGAAKCPYSPHANVTSLITSSGQYFAAGPTDFSGADSAIVRDFLGSYLRTNQYNSKWLNEPQFVGSFETDAYVYFLFRETAVEYINCGKRIYSRIARVCKNDQGGQVMLRDNWTTFQKARLNCSLPGEYPFYFDEIQAISYLPDEGLVYATFTTPPNSIAGSAICCYNLSAINAAFSGPFKHQSTVGSAWERVTSSHHSQNQCHNTDPQFLLDSSKYQLMDNAVQPLAITPLYHSELETLGHIAVDVLPTKLHREMHVIYVSTGENIIKKISVLPRTQKTCLVEVWKPFDSESSRILSLHYLKQTESLYIGTENSVLRISSQHCKRHKSRPACLNAMDPYCGWNELKEQCSPPPEQNPLISYWIQSVTSCPTFTHPVAGGWSSWSPWKACSHVFSSSEPSDQCMCSSRNCDNPLPQFGGPHCEGVSIQVTNCTVHGGWTAWSAWSACSESCGMAVKTRKRSCSNPAPAFGGRVCVGQDSQEMYCHNNPPCPDISQPARDGGWSSWGPWSECSAKCGGGYRVRSRKCDNPPPQKPGGMDCQGCAMDYELCNAAPCVESKKLSAWTPWIRSENGTEKRFRFLCRAPVIDVNSIKIAPTKEEERICQEDGICYRAGGSDSDDPWSEWSPWSACSVECGGGTQFRTRTCEGRSEECYGLPRMSRSCNTHTCKSEWSCWNDWSSCSVSCGTGIKRRTRKCLSSSDRQMDGTGCEGQSFAEEPCYMPPCEDAPGWDKWSAWSPCDENLRQYRTRKCIEPKLCVGTSRDERDCLEEKHEVLLAGIQSKQFSEPPSSVQLMVFCAFAFASGLIISASIAYYRSKTNQQSSSLRSNPHYIIPKQNSYVTVPMKEVHLPKRTSSFRNGSTLANPKLFSTGAALGEYETATIKRNSHSLLNGTRTLNLPDEGFN